MIRYRTFSIAITICFLYLFGMVKSSHGFEITSMSVENGASGCYVSLTADEDISWVDWYLKQKDDNDFEYADTSMPGAGIRSVDENIGYLVGSHNGTTYTIKAIAWSKPDADGNVQMAPSPTM